MSLKSVFSNIVSPKKETADRLQEEMYNHTDGRVGKMVLRTDNLVKKYRQRTVVNHVSIDVTQGEIVGLLGPQRCWQDYNVLYDHRSDCSL